MFEYVISNHADGTDEPARGSEAKTSNLVQTCGTQIGPVEWFMKGL